MAEAAAKRHWQLVADRLLLYLRCLDFSAPRALELALQAVKEAEIKLGRREPGGRIDPVAESMQALLRLLSTQGVEDSNRGRPILQPGPPCCRRHMVSGEKR